MRFLDLHAESRIPDEKTVWFYRETLAEGGHIEGLFERFEERLQETMAGR